MKRSALAILTLVVLRLALGWHFFDAGIEKLDPSFSSAGFLRGAKGPLAPMFRGFVTGPHDAAKFLWQPVNANSDVAETTAKEDLAAWLDRIRSDWNEGLTRVGRLGASEEQLEAARSAADKAIEGLREYAEEESQFAALVDLRHEVWRLKKMNQSATDDPAPFQRERIDDQEAENWRALQPWLRAAQLTEEAFSEKVLAIVGDSADRARVRLALKERSGLRRVDNAVTVVVLGAGILLFLGLFTPLAAVVAAGFVLSAMATQPPWVDGANTTYFFYQLVEVAALAAVAALGAGRWAGLDRLVFGRPMIVAEPSDPSHAAS